MSTIPFKKEDAYFWLSEDGEIFGFAKPCYGDHGWFGYLIKETETIFSCSHDTFEECCEMMQDYIENTLKIEYYTG